MRCGARGCCGLVSCLVVRIRSYEKHNLSSDTRTRPYHTKSHDTPRHTCLRALRNSRVSPAPAPGSLSTHTHATSRRTRVATTAFSETRGSLPGAAPAAAARVGGDRGGDRCRRPQSAVHGSLIGNNNRTPGRHTVVRRPQAPILPRRCHSAATSSTAHRAESVLAADMLSRWLLAAFARAGRPARLTRHAIVPRRYAVLPLESTSLTPSLPSPLLRPRRPSRAPITPRHHVTPALSPHPPAHARCTWLLPCAQMFSDTRLTRRGLP